LAPNQRPLRLPTFDWVDYIDKSYTARNLKIDLNNIKYKILYKIENNTRMDYSTLSKELTSKLSKDEKKDNGIYFTPPSCIYNNLQLLQPYISNITSVLEPSCGSGEYIRALHSLYPTLNITGIEYNKTIYDSIVGHFSGENITIRNEDYLQYKPTTKYDLIIGNPPYYVMKKDAVSKEYYKYFDGRPNIFILFIVKSLQMLNENGILSFILPKNFLNCLYYDKTRAFIKDKFQILHIVDCKDDKYIETQQETIILIIKKCGHNLTIENLTIDNSPFVLSISGHTIFTNEQIRIKELYNGAKTLSELGFKVSVGTVVWNQCKTILTDDNTQTRLIYSSDIQNNALAMKQYNNDQKKNYIKKAGNKRPLIVINRGYGVGEYKFNYCLIDTDKDYLIENHLICIEYMSLEEELPRNELIDKYNKIINSLKDKRTQEFIDVYFGNNAVNTTELNSVLPIYDI
jgi:type I restriction-modification system DNA methylase subunit